MMFSGGLTLNPHINPKPSINPKPHINPKPRSLASAHHPFENPLEPSYHNLVTKVPPLSNLSCKPSYFPLPFNYT
jgi:hypothetical protein